MDNMYFALNQNKESFDTYLSFLSDILNNNNQKYIDIFKDIISGAKKLSETNDFYSVQSERFSIISLFAKNHELIESIDVTQIQRKDYQRLFEYLKNEAVIEQ
jgi:hypothetical protein